MLPRHSLRTGYVYFIVTSVPLAALFASFAPSIGATSYMTPGGWLFLVIAAISHATLFTLAPLLLFTVVVAFLLRLPRLGKALHVIATSLLYLFFLLDLFVFRLYRFHINGFVVDMATGPGASQMYDFDASLWVRVGLFAALLFGLSLALFRLSGLLERRMRHLHPWLTVLVFACMTLCAHLTHAWGDAVRYIPVVKSAATLPYYFPLTANKLLTRLGLITHDRGAIEMSLSHDRSAIAYPRRPLVTDPERATHFNIVHILLDSWNHRTQEREEIPHIRAFADSCQTYARHRSSSNGTRSSLFGMFFGIYPTYWDDFEVEGVRPVLVSELLRQGYHINVFPSACFKQPNFNEVLFGDVPGGVATDTPGEDAFETDARITTDCLAHLDTIANDGRPFYALLFYDAPHCGLAPPDQCCHFRPYAKFMDYLKLTNETDPTPYYNMYRNAVCYDDSLVGLVLDRLRSLHLLERTVVIVTGDHGQEFNDTHHNYWGHSSTYTTAQTAVPFFLHVPGRPPGRLGHATTHYDVAPTLLHDVLGVTSPIDEHSVGHLLGDTVPRRWHLMGNELNFAFAVDGYILEKKPAGNVEVTDEQMNPMPSSVFDRGELMEALRDINRFRQ